VISSSQTPLLTQHIANKGKNIHAINEIRTRDPRNQAATRLRLSPDRHRNFAVLYSVLLQNMSAPSELNIKRQQERSHLLNHQCKS